MCGQLGLSVINVLFCYLHDLRIRPTCKHDKGRRPNMNMKMMKSGEEIKKMRMSVDQIGDHI